MLNSRLRRGATSCLLLPGLWLVAACGGTTSSTAGGGSGAPTADPALVARIPPAIAAKGALVVAADASYAPNEFVDTDGKTVIGMDPDLAAAIGQVLGLKVSVVNVKFDNILPGLASGKYDVGMSSFTDNKTREQTVDFVTYFTAGTSFFVNGSGGPKIESLADLCGHHVAVESGTTQQTDAQSQNTKCTAGGKAAVDVQAYPDQNTTNLALSSHRADVSMADSPVAAYQVKQSNGVFALSGPSYGDAPYGIALPKGTSLTAVFLGAVKDIMAAGTYTTILEKWGVKPGAISDPKINGATG